MSRDNILSTELIMCSITLKLLWLGVAINLPAYDNVADRAYPDIRSSCEPF